MTGQSCEHKHNIFITLYGDIHRNVTQRSASFAAWLHIWIADMCCAVPMGKEPQS
jgi:hypothetical protein